MDIIYIKEEPYEIKLEDLIYWLDYDHQGPVYFYPKNQKNYLFKDYGITWAYEKGDFI